jgi:hypothetical protein
VRQREEHRVYALPLLFQLREEEDKREVPGFARQRGASGGAEAADKSQRDTPMSEISKISERGGDPHFLSLSGGAEAAERLLYLCPPHTSAYVSIRQHMSAYVSRSSLPRCRSSFTVSPAQFLHIITYDL